MFLEILYAWVIESRRLGEKFLKISVVFLLLVLLSVGEVVVCFYEEDGTSCGLRKTKSARRFVK